MAGCQWKSVTQEVSEGEIASLCPLFPSPTPASWLLPVRSQEWTWEHREKWPVGKYLVAGAGWLPLSGPVISTLLGSFLGPSCISAPGPSPSWGLRNALASGWLHLCPSWYHSGQSASCLCLLTPQGCPWGQEPLKLTSGQQESYPARALGGGRRAAPSPLWLSPSQVPVSNPARRA